MKILSRNDKKMLSRINDLVKGQKVIKDTNKHKMTK